MSVLKKRRSPKNPQVRITTGPNPIFTRVWIDGVELRQVSRVWFDTGDVGKGRRPGRDYREESLVHVEFYADVQLDGEMRPDLIALEAVQP